MRKVPKLRFKEFSDEWKEKKLGEFGKISMCKRIMKDQTTLTGDIPFYKIGTFGKKADAYIDKKLFEEYKEKYSFPKKGDILLSASGTIGRTVIYDGKPAYFQDSNIVWIATNEKIILNSFLNYLYSNIKWTIENTTIARLYNDNLANMKVNIPFLQEQEKIANFLSSVDKKISLTEEKLELFREYKKGVMQKIFSQELRFKDSEGNDYPEWEEKRLEEVTECLDNLRKPLNSNEREKIKGNIPYYGANGIQGYINNYIFNEELVLLAEDGGNFDDYLTKPIAQYVQGKSWINNHAHVLKGKKVLKTKFLYFSLVHKDIRSFINGTSRSKLNKSNMLNIIILLPTVEEQHKIADFLSSIDSKIESIEKELERLKEFKKGLLQQMFV